MGFFYSRGGSEEYSASLGNTSLSRRSFIMKAEAQRLWDSRKRSCEGNLRPESSRGNSGGGKALCLMSIPDMGFRVEPLERFY